MGIFIQPRTFLNPYRNARLIKSNAKTAYDLNKIEDRVCEIFNIDRKDIFSKSRKKVRADARGLFCFWAVSEIGCGQKELAKKLGMTQPGVGYAVIRGEAISKLNHFELKKMT